MNAAHLTEAVRIARMLEDARDTARRIFRSDYEARVKPWRETVTKLAAAWGCRPVEVAPRLEREGAMPANPLLLFAAIVELSEARQP